MGKDLRPCLGMEGVFKIFKVMSLHMKRNNGGKLEIKCVMLRMKTIISQEKVSKRIARMCMVNIGDVKKCCSKKTFLK